MKLSLPAVNEPVIRVLVDADQLYSLDFHGTSPQEVEIDIPGVDLDRVPIGYVAVASSGEEVGEPALLKAPKHCVEPPKTADKSILGKSVVTTEAAAAPRPTVELPPDAVKFDEKVEVKVGRKK